MQNKNLKCNPVHVCPISPSLNLFSPLYDCTFEKSFFFSFEFLLKFLPLGTPSFRPLKIVFHQSTMPLPYSSAFLCITSEVYRFATRNFQGFRNQVLYCIHNQNLLTRIALAMVAHQWLQRNVDVNK
jgi:hypothetical protein